MTSLPAASPDQVLQEITSANAALLERFLRDLPSAGNADLTALLRVFTQADDNQLEKLRALQMTLYRGHFTLWHQFALPVNDLAFSAPPSDD